jgi:nitrite reductase/ring-hydroxylating ferredoxin subunit
VSSYVAAVQVRAGSLEELQKTGCVVTKVGSTPVCVVWHDGRAFAVDDRCPHMGFPLHRGTVENGLLTCHWHHARFDLESGGTLDPFADDVRAYDVEVRDGEVLVGTRPDGDVIAHQRDRLVEGLEQGLTLVTAKSVLALLEAGMSAEAVVAEGLAFGTAYRGEGWGSGLTVLTAMANLLPHLEPDDRPLALVHGLAFVSRDTRGHSPRFPLGPLGHAGVEPERLASWYRRFVDTRSGDAAERALVTAARDRTSPDDVARMVFAAATDHVFLDEGHVLDFTMKALEVLDHVGPGSAAIVLPTLAHMTARARRSEEEGQWRHPHDLAALVAEASARLPEQLARGAAHRGRWTDADTAHLAWDVLGDDPSAVIDAVEGAVASGATPEQLGRAVALAAGLRIVRFHVQNDFADWNVVHHGFTYANGLHQALARFPSTELLRGVLHGAGRVYLDRFLNVPAARLPAAEDGDLAELAECWDEQGHVDRAGTVVYGYLRAGGDPAAAVRAIGRALLAEDAGFHWYQTVEAAVRQFHAWPAGSDEGRLLLAGCARFLAAHTPTRRELPQVVRIATRLRRGEALYEEG